MPDAESDSVQPKEPAEPAADPVVTLNEPEKVNRLLIQLLFYTMCYF